MTVLHLTLFEWTTIGVVIALIVVASTTRARGFCLDWHLWRGVGRSSQGEMFVFSIRLGFVTASMCKQCVAETYRALRARLESVADDLDPQSKLRRHDGQ